MSEEFLSGIPGHRLLELSYEQFPEVRRVLFTAHGASDILLAAINQGTAAQCSTLSSVECAAQPGCTPQPFARWSRMSSCGPR